MSTELENSIKYPNMKIYQVLLISLRLTQL